MSALISRQGYTLDDFPQQGNSTDYWAYNDPWDYFGFVMANSGEYSNADGYGVVAYRNGDTYLSSRGMWYKRIYDINDFGTTYYTGHYIDHGADCTDWTHDILDDALFTVKGGEDHPAIVMCHARTASGLTYGNHPFTFQNRGRTFSFMHNGSCNASRAYMIARVHQMNPDNNWFVQHPSNYFAQTNPQLWVDTEVLFHYIMSYIQQSRGEVLPGLHSALAALRPYLEDSHAGVYNFIMSDGSKLYAFRNTPISGTNSHYKLSYRDFNEQFYGIRTQALSAGDIEIHPLELVVFSRDQKPHHYANITWDSLNSLNPDASPSTSRSETDDVIVGLVINPNPISSAEGYVQLRFTRVDISGLDLGRIDIFNTRGQRVFSKEILCTQCVSTYNLNLPTLPNGVYLCRVQVGQQTASAKLSIVK